MHGLHRVQPGKRQFGWRIAVSIVDFILNLLSLIFNFVLSLL